MPDVVTGVMGGVSLLSAGMGADAASDSADAQAMQIQLEAQRDEYNKEIIEESNEFSREDRADIIARRDRERELIDPIQEGIIDRAAKGPDTEGAMARSDADVSQTYGIERDKMRRRESRYGVNPASGRAGAEERRFSNAEALAKVAGRNKARLQEDDRDWARKIAALGTGNMRDARPNQNLTQLGPSGQAGAYGGAAASQGANASAAFGLSGSLMADAVNRYDASNTGISTRSTTGSTYNPAFTPPPEL